MRLLSRLALVAIVLGGAAAFTLKTATPSAAQPAHAPGCAPDGPRAGCAEGDSSAAAAAQQDRDGPEEAEAWDASAMPRREREEYRRQMLSVRTSAECRSVLDEHLAQANRRAKARGLGPVPPPRQDVCAGLPD